MIKIVQWQEEYAKDFIALSLEWLEKYVRVEEADKKILYNPHETILEKGGMIFFAREDQKNVGTLSMIRVNSSTFELAKFAVTPSYKGKGIGHLLMEHAVFYAKSKKAKKIILFTNSKLETAIHLYKKYGFTIVPLVDNEYEESDMKMELIV